MSYNVAASLPRVPLRCFWEITEACNLRCIHCEVDAGRRAPDELSTEEAWRVAGELADAQCESVCLTGGEPLLREDWPELSRRLHELGLRVTVITNGVLVDRPMVQRLLAAGVFGISVSLDGSREVHDRIRLPASRCIGSSYDAALRAIRLAAESRLKTAVITQVHRHSLGELTRMYEELVALGIDMWQVQLCMPLGRMPTHAPEYLIAPSELPGLEELLASLIDDGRLAIAVGDNIGYYGRHEPALRGAVRGTKTFWLGCPAGCRVVALCANGDVKGCPSHPRALVVGNLRETPLREIWADRRRFAYNTEWDEALLEGRCRACEFRQICRAGCTTMAYVTSGTIYDNPYCIQRALGAPVDP
jgi:radical SAM protein with 4Fe4S-binding SPASM domain